VDNDGELTLIYTAHNHNHSPKEVQCLAASTDGIHFVKYEHNPVIPAPPAGYGEDFRDPYVFRRGEDWHLIAGCTRNGRGGVLLYKSKDLRRWGLAGQFCESDGSQGTMWECPSFFELDGVWTLLCSPMNMKGAKCIFMTGTADFEKPAFIQERRQNADYGHEFYAPQVFQDERGRKILIGWMDMWGGESPTRRDGWAGAFTFPRELFLKNGAVCQKPVEELALLRKKELFSGRLNLSPGEKDGLPNITGDCLEITFTIPAAPAENPILNLLIRASPDRKEKTLLQWDLGARIFTLDKEQSGAGLPKKITVPWEEEGNMEVQILIDRSSVEVFLFGGKYAVTSRIYPRPSSVCCGIFTEKAGLSIPALRIMALGQIGYNGG
jgi:beta-fructofuranosidase